MKYRIKIVTFQTDRQTFFPQKKVRFGWKYLNSIGEESYINYNYDTRDRALICIDRNYSGNNKIKQIEFEYIIPKL